MKRRDFLARGAVGVLGATIADSVVSGSLLGREVTLPAARTAAGARRGEPAPISEAEYAERRAKAQRLMAERHMQALFVEPGANLLYFSGIRWGRSERLFGMLLPRAGAPVFIVPAFETARAAAQVGNRF